MGDFAVSVLKAVVAGAVSVALWLTSQLGEAWWILLVLLAIDGLLNWHDERGWLSKLGTYLVATAVSLYVQSGAGIPTLHLLLVALCGWEAIRVGDQLMTRYTSWRATLPTQLQVHTPPAPDLAARVASLEALVRGIAGRIPPEVSAHTAAVSGGGGGPGGAV